MQIVHDLHFNNLRGDIYGGLTAAVVALPLAYLLGRVPLLVCMGLSSLVFLLQFSAAHQPRYPVPPVP